MGLEVTRKPATTGTAATPSAKPRMVWLRPRLVLIVAGIGLVGALLARPMMASIYLSLGTAALNEARLQTGEPSSDPTVMLERAHVFAPNDPLVLRRLAEAYTFQGRYDEAVAALESAVALQPSSVLVRQALADSYLRAGRTEVGTQLARSLGPPSEEILLSADQLFAAGRFSEAVQQYDQARAELETVPDDAVFRHLVALWRIGSQEAATPYGLHQLAVLLGEGDRQVRGADLRMLQILPSLGVTYGMPLGLAFEQTGNPNPEPAGVFWLDSTAGVVLLVEDPGEYSLQITARHRGLPPAELLIAVDEAPIATAEVAGPEGEWQVIEQVIDLQPGLNLLSLRFTNPLFIEGGEDRKVEIAALLLRKLP